MERRVLNSDDVRWLLDGGALEIGPVTICLADEHGALIHQLAVCHLAPEKRPCVLGQTKAAGQRYVPMTRRPKRQKPKKRRKTDGTTRTPQIRR